MEASDVALAILAWPLAAVGVATLALGAMLAQPVKSPPPLESIQPARWRSPGRQAGAQPLPGARRHVARLPALSRRRRRTDRLAILAHGSSASSEEMNAVALALAQAGFVAVAIDARGHGASGSRGDIGYVGQLEDDLADLVAQLREAYPKARLTLIGHSAGGGFALRVAGAPVGASIRPVRAARALSRLSRADQSPCGRAGTLGVARHSAHHRANDPRAARDRLGRSRCRSSPSPIAPRRPNSSPRVIPFACSQTTARRRTGRRALQAAAGRIELIAGENDELMDAPAYQGAVAPLGVRVTLLPGVDHMGVVYQPAALAAIVGGGRSRREASPSGTGRRGGAIAMLVLADPRAYAALGRGRCSRFSSTRGIAAMRRARSFAVSRSDRSRRLPRLGRFQSVRKVGRPGAECSQRSSARLLARRSGGARARLAHAGAAPRRRSRDCWRCRVRRSR